MKKNINLTIDKEDHSTNDYILSWFELGVRPSKTTIHGYFKPEPFLNFMKDSGVTEISEFTDVIPSEEVSVINQKNFVSIGSDVFLTYTNLDKEHTESIITDVSIYFTLEQREKVYQIVENLTNLTLLSEETQDEEISHNLSILNIGQNGFELEYFDCQKDFEDIEYYYEDETLKNIKKAIKSIKKEKKGITIICGDRGCGKTNLISYISSKVDKNFILLPCNLIENSLSNAEFRKFLKMNKNSVLIIDDAELFFSQMYSKSTFYTNNLLQLVEGLHSDTLNLNIILSLNCSLNEIDKTILTSNEVIDVIEIGKLSLEKIEEICEYLDRKSNFKNPSKLVDVLKNNKSNNKSELGFK